MSAALNLKIAEALEDTKPRDAVMALAGIVAGQISRCAVDEVKALAIASLFFECVLQDLRISADGAMPVLEDIGGVPFQ